MKILYINSTACDMLGVHRPNVLRRDFGAKGAMVNEGLSQKARQLLALCHTQDATVTNSHACDQKGSLMYIDLIAIPKAQGKGAILVLQDKTESHRLVEMGKDFVANASHELRTPITIIQGYAETLRDFPDVPRAQYVEITEKISRNCERMETLVKSLLTLADIDHLSDKRLIETDLSTLVVNSRHIFRSAYPDITVTIDAPFKQEMLVEADPSLLELALVNLLENAAKYSEPPAQITVSLQPQSEAEVVIQVADHGRGIPQGDLAHIFQRFYRVDKSHSRRLGGAGLGLSIVKTIIDKHRGTIRVKSTLGQGTTFTMTLPRLPVVKKGQK